MKRLAVFVSLALLAAILSLTAVPALAAQSISIGSLGEVTALSLVYYDPKATEPVDLSAVSGPQIDLAVEPDKNLLYCEVTFSATKAEIWYGLPGATRYRLPLGESKVLTIPPGTTCGFYDGQAGREILSIRVRVNTSLSYADAPLEDPPEGQLAWIAGCLAFAPVYEKDTTASAVIGWARLGEVVYLQRWGMGDAFCYLLYNRASNAGWVEGCYIYVEEA